MTLRGGGVVLFISVDSSFSLPLTSSSLFNSSLKSSFSVSVTERGETFFILGGVKGVSREGNSTGLYSVEGSSDYESFDLFADTSENSVS